MRHYVGVLQLSTLGWKQLIDPVCNRTSKPHMPHDVHPYAHGNFKWVVVESLGSHQEVLGKSAGSHQEVIRESSGSHQGVIRESSGSHQGVIKESLGSHSRATCLAMQLSRDPRADLCDRCLPGHTGTTGQPTLLHGYRRLYPLKRQRV